MVNFLEYFLQLHSPHSFSLSRIIIKILEFYRFKGHEMLAPFTAGWQSTDVNPLVIEKSKVKVFARCAILVSRPFM